MRQFNDPSSGLELRIRGYGLLLLPSRSDVRDKAVFLGRRFFADVRRVQTEILLPFSRRRNDSAFQQRFQRNAVMPIGSGDDE